VSSNHGDLDDLNRKMISFYSAIASRERYQGMLDSEESMQPQTESALERAILAHGHGRVLEFGCGSGRLYERLRTAGFDGAYVGIEMSEAVIVRNRQRYDGATWMTGSVLDLELPDGSFDVVYSYFVLEHCVYPEQVLSRAMRLAKPTGVALLV